MKPNYLIMFLALLILSCGHKQVTSHKPDTPFVEKKYPKKAVETKEDSTSTVIDTTKLLNYNCTHLFSDTAKKDNFYIALFGKNIIDGIIILEIDDYKHRQLFRETFPASDLLGDMADVLNKKQQADTIRVRMGRFFDESNFNSPAIDGKDLIEDDMGTPDKNDKDNWGAIKADPTAIRFIYSHGYESTYGIAFSKKKRKVVEIFYSD